MNKKYIIAGAIGVLTLSIFFFLDNGEKRALAEKPLTDFAQCLKESGAIFYGAYWCPICQQQKVQFKSAAKELPYTECSTANGQGRLPVCEEAGIENYPTWVFADESRLSGQQTFATLAEKTSCAVPEGF